MASDRPTLPVNLDDLHANASLGSCLSPGMYLLLPIVQLRSGWYDTTLTARAMIKLMLKDQIWI